MKIKKKAMLYDIANMAYLVADTGENGNHTLHRVRDICEEGNIDRVSRVLGLAYSQLLTVLFPILRSPCFDINRDRSASPHDYEFLFRRDEKIKYSLTTERKLKIKETCHEYMVCKVLADWLEITLPVAAEVWKFRYEKALKSLRTQVGEILMSISCGIRRRLCPW